MALTVAEMYWLWMLFQELKVPLFHPPCLWVDNLGPPLSLSSNPVFHAHTKHIEVDYHFIREKIFNRDLFARYIPTQFQPSDIFTNGLAKARFLLLHGKLMVVSLLVNVSGAVKDMIPVSSVPTSNRDKSAANPAACIKGRK
jgi:hypothetical protein